VVYGGADGARRNSDVCFLEPIVIRIAAVFFDRDGTLIEDVPYNGDPARVRPVAGVPQALGRLRGAGLHIAVISNQSGVARGLITAADVEAVNRRVDDLLGPFDGWFYCPHGPDLACACRKPEPGLILEAAQSLQVAPESCVMVGDKLSDLAAAFAARAYGLRVGQGAGINAAVDLILASRNR
jgi:D-glycero-D-manno-heptose 1,7-bisphosphate phosphatase